MQKIKNIEFLRCILMFGIVMLHVCLTHKWSFDCLFTDIPLYQLLHSCFKYANLGVEGFFIIAGFLFFVTFKNSHKFKDFVLKKYIRLSPVIIFSMLIAVVGWLLGTLHFKFIPNLLTIFLLNNFFYCWSGSSNGVLWFTSALFSGLILYFCILKFLPKNIKRFMIILLVVASYGITLYFQGGRFFKPCTNYYIFNAGFLRAVGGLGVGCLIADIFKFNIEKIQLWQPKLWHKICINFLEIILFIFVIYWLFIPHITINPMLFVILFSILFFLFICKKTFLANITDNDIWVFLGKYQFSIYCVHFIVNKILNLALWKHFTTFVYSYPIIPLLFNLGIIIFVGVFAYHCVEEPCAKYLKQKLFNNSKTLVNTDISGGGNG